MSRRFGLGSNSARSTNYRVHAALLLLLTAGIVVPFR
jgi:hypothetical protein